MRWKKMFLPAPETAADGGKMPIAKKHKFRNVLGQREMPIAKVQDPMEDIP